LTVEHLFAQIGTGITTVPFTRGRASRSGDGFRVPHTALFLFLPLRLSLGGEDSLVVVVCLLSSTGSSSGGLLFGLRVWENENIDWDVPGLVARDLVAEAEDLTAEEPVHQSNGVLTLVVARNGNIDITERAISVSEGNDGDVTIRGFSQGLVILDGVSDDQQARLLVLSLDVVGEGTGGEATGNWGSLGVRSELKDGTLGEGGGTRGLDGADSNVSWVLDGGNDTGSKDELFPGFAEVDDMNTILSASLKDIARHVGIAVTGTQVDLASQHLLDVLIGQS